MFDMSNEKPEHSDPGAIQGHIALKGFFGICSEWDCSEEEIRLLLGGVLKRTLDDYLKLPHLMLSPEMLERISYILGIYKSLRAMYPNDERASRRMRLSTSEPPFSGLSAIEFMTSGSIQHLKQTRRYFESKKVSA